MKKILFIILLLLLSGCSIIDEKPDYTMTAVELSSLYDENEIQASLTYDDKLIQVDGYVKSVSGDKDEVVISLYPDIIIYISNKIEEVIDIENGAYIVIIGTLYERRYLMDSTVKEYNNIPDAKYSMTLEDFVNDIQDNKELGFEKYQYSYIEITGDAYKSVFGEDYIMISALYGGYGDKVNVYFEDESIIETIDNGNKITIVGLFTDYGMFGNSYNFKYCRVLELELD
jgi:hypothetical protein